MYRYFTFNTVVELICLLIAFLCLIRDKDLVWRSIILFLLITCIAEMLGIYIKWLYLADRVHVHPNVWVYNILMIFQAGFISLMFSALFKKYFNSKLIIISGLALLVTIYTYEICEDGLFKKHNLTTTTMSVLFVAYSLYYFYCLLKDEAYIRLKYYSPFWWVAGLLFFYFGSTACNLFYYKLSVVTVTPKHYLTYYIYNGLNLILYGCWSYSFICRRWLTTTSKNLS
jgi:hypothetical protein